MDEPLGPTGDKQAKCFVVARTSRAARPTFLNVFVKVLAAAPAAIGRSAYRLAQERTRFNRLGRGVAVLRGLFRFVAERNSLPAYQAGDRLVFGSVVEMAANIEARRLTALPGNRPFQRLFKSGGLPIAQLLADPTRVANTMVPPVEGRAEVDGQVLVADGQDSARPPQALADAANPFSFRPSPLLTDVIGPPGRPLIHRRQRYRERDVFHKSPRPAPGGLYPIEQNLRASIQHALHIRETAMMRIARAVNCR